MSRSVPVEAKGSLPTSADLPITEHLRKHLIATGRTAAAGHLLCAVLVFGVLGSMLGPIPLYIWLGTVVVGAIVRGIVSRRPNATLNALRWAAFINAATWGAGALTLGQGPTLIDVLFVMVVFAGLVAAGASTLAADATAFYGYLALMLLPLEIAVIRHPTAPMQTAAAISIRSLPL